MSKESKGIDISESLHNQIIKDFNNTMAIKRGIKINEFPTPETETFHFLVRQIAELKHELLMVKNLISKQTKNDKPK